MATITRSMPPCVYDFDEAFDDVRIVYQSPRVVDPKKATYILFQEDHVRYGSIAAVIHQYVTEGSIMLVEGVRALKELKDSDRKKFIGIYNLSSSSASQLTFLGWDALDHMSTHDKVNWVAKFEPRHGDFELSNRSLFDNELLADTIPLLYQLETQDDLSEQHRELLADCRKQQAKRLLETFPHRTQAMVHTLQQMERIKNIRGLVGKVFLSAGGGHLQTPGTYKDPRLDLTPLFDTLNQLDAIVVCPTEYDRPFTAWDRAFNPRYQSSQITLDELPVSDD